eukprot:8542611-Lingulodinium_polyedra.AAC.1
MTRDERAAARQAAKKPSETVKAACGTVQDVNKTDIEDHPAVPSIEAIEVFVGSMDKQFEEFWDGKGSATDRLRRPSPLKDAPRTRQRSKPYSDEARMQEVLDRDNPPCQHRLRGD